MSDEIRLVAMARTRPGVAPEFYFPAGKGDWADAWDAGIPLDELPDDLRRRVDAEG